MLNLRYPEVIPGPPRPSAIITPAGREKQPGTMIALGRGGPGITSG